MVPAGGPGGLVTGPAVKTLQELEARHRAALPRLPSEALLPPGRGGFLSTGSSLVFPWGVTGLETGGFTSDPHCQQNLAVEVKSSPGLGLSETEPSSRRTLASFFLSCQSVC